MSVPLEGLRAVVFDAYGTLFDVASAAERARDELGDRWPALAETWRAKQLHDASSNSGPARPGLAAQGR